MKIEEARDGAWKILSALGKHYPGVGDHNDATAPDAIEAIVPVLLEIVSEQTKTCATPMYYLGPPVQYVSDEHGMVFPRPACSGHCQEH